MMNQTLPEGCEIRNYSGDLLLIGVDLTARKFREIKNTLPSEIQERLIGWRRIAG